jgi:hypothetical protein
MKRILFFLIWLNLASCNSCKKTLEQSTNTLPPATEVGANTLGAIIDGNVWVPAGSNGTANLAIYYDPGYASGTLDISAYRITDTVLNDRTYLAFGVDSLNNYAIPHTFVMQPQGNTALGFTQYPCAYESTDSITRTSGAITITKLDIVGGIVSGTFSGTLIKPGCGTITITDGRFDIKLN